MFDPKTGTQKVNDTAEGVRLWEAIIVPSTSAVDELDRTLPKLEMRVKELEDEVTDHAQNIADNAQRISILEGRGGSGGGGGGGGGGGLLSGDPDSELFRSLCALPPLHPDRLGSHFQRIHQQKLEKGFVGRRWVFEAIDQWCDDDNGERVMLIRGGPGTGKSTLIAALMKEAPREPGVPHGLHQRILHCHVRTPAIVATCCFEYMCSREQ